MELIDLCPMEKWEDLENNIFEKFNFQASVFTPQGVRITNVKNFSNKLCPFIKASEKGQSYICSVAHMSMTGMAKNAKAPVVEECDAGLVKLVVPIFLKDEFIGVAGGCGLLPEQGEVDTFAIGKIMDLDEDKISSVCSDVPAIRAETIDAATAYIQEEIGLILETVQ